MQVERIEAASMPILEEAASLVAWLASAEASFVTGQFWTVMAAEWRN